MDTASHSVFCSPESIAPQALAALLGRPDTPLILDVRRDVRFDESERIVPGARRCAPEDVAALASSEAPRSVIAYCVHGLEIGANAAQALRTAGWDARFLQGGIEGLADLHLPTLRKRADLGVTGEAPSRWITRERPKIDRVACPWLVRRFIDPRAQFAYVPAASVLDEAARTRAVAFDVDGAPITHDGELCSFDTLLRAFDLHDAGLDRLARIVRGADTGRLDLAPQSAGLLAFSRGLSQLHAADDAAMLEAAMPLYDALYAWCRAEEGAAQ